MSEKTKPPPSMPPLSARGVKSALSAILIGLQNRTIDEDTALAAAKVAAQINNIMRTELDAARLHCELSAAGNKDGYALTAIGYSAPSEQES